MRQSHLTILICAFFLLAAAGSALAQAQKPGLTGRSDEARQNDAAFDAQYRARRNSNDTEPKADPWGSVRTPASQPAATATTTKKAKN